MTQMRRQIGLILGSYRRGGNGVGLASWLSAIVQPRLKIPPPDGVQPLQLVNADDFVSLPLGTLTDGSYLPDHIRDSSQYPSPTIQAWSQFIKDCSGLIFLSPQYNGGYPGELKNSIDHLFWEWRDKPAVIVTYGSRGGPACSEELNRLLTKLKIKVVDRSVQVTLPPEFIGGEERVTARPAGDEYPLFLSQYAEGVEKATEELMRAIDAKP